MIEIKIQKINEDATLPKYARPGDSGADLFSTRDYTLKPGEKVLIGTGIKLQIPEGYEGQIRSKSGLAAKHGIAVLNSPGTIDSHFRGEVGVILINHGRESYNVEKGQKVAQLVFQKVEQGRFKLAESLDETVRGEGGFGSTGK